MADDNELAELVRKGLIKDPDLVKKYAGASTVPAKSVNKYNATKLEVDGHVFDSKAEADYYSQLLLRKIAGELKSIELQPRFELQPSFKCNGKAVKGIFYVADFRVITAAGEEVVIDVKSVATEKNAVYRLKRKMLLYRYPGIDFREV